jgi:hypothetical protein
LQDLDTAEHFAAPEQSDPLFEFLMDFNQNYPASR